MFDEELEEQMLSGNIMIAILSEEGNITWIVTGNPTKQQKNQFQKIYVLTNKPSLVLKAFMFIEIRMLKFLVLIENLFKKLRGKNE